jgi:hypothetical protein
MTIYCGGDFHARQQTVCYCDTTDGEIHLAELGHEGDEFRGFYSAFTGEVKRASLPDARIQELQECNNRD